MVGPGAGDENQATLITLAQAASLIYCSQRTIERWIQNGDLPAHRYGDGGRRVTPQAVLELERQQRHSGRSRLHTRGAPLADQLSLS